jgi:hypothetical protein
MGSAGKASFLVTIWTERSEESTGPTAWRGSVEHLTTRRRLYFSAPSELIGFLGCEIRPAAPRGDPNDS